MLASNLPNPVSQSDWQISSDLQLSPSKLEARNPQSWAEYQHAKATTKRQEAAHWLARLTGSLVPSESDEAFRAALADGTTLCHLLNVLRPGTIPRIIDRCSNGTGELLQTFENVSNFIAAVPQFTLRCFTASDLEGPGER
jgi:hypothetical protein